MINILRSPKLTEDAIEFLRSDHRLALFFHADEEVVYWFSQRSPDFKDAFWKAYEQSHGGQS